MPSIKWPADRVERRSIDDLIPYARNARTHSEAQIAQIAASMCEWGWTNPVLIDSGGQILAGHGRVLAARALGFKECPVMIADGWTQAQKRAYILADNRIAENAGWDEAMLKVELEALQEDGFNLDLTGFDDDALLELLAGEEPDTDGQTDDDDVPEVTATPVSRTGDVWLLGAHRLVCGDAGDPQVIAALMQSDRATLCFTSPPYDNQRDYTSGGIADWDSLMRNVFGNVPMTEDGQLLVNLGLIHRNNEVIPYWETWIGWMRIQGWRRFAWYVWDQGPGMPGDWAGRFAPSFEFVFHFNRTSRKPNKIVPCKFAGQETHLRADGSSTAMRGKDGEVGGWTHKGQPTQDNRVPDSVIRVMRHKGKIGQGIDHPAVFPVSLPEFVIDAFTDKGDIVYEPFCGSGTTMLAAQRTNRVCRLVEIAPEYVDVAVKRFQQNFTDVPVTLQATGQSFAEVASERLNTMENAQ